jgi:hypothetical protein
MNNRDSFEFEEVNDNVVLNVVTKCPSKWLLVDRETGQVYQGNAGGYWDKLKTVERVDK